MSTPFKPEWLQPGAVIPVDIPTLAAFAEELRRVNQENQALRQALETEQEPVAWISEGGDVSRSKRYMDEMGFKCNPLYTEPSKREWVGLTEREVELIDEMIETQLLHAERCDHMANSTMAQKQKAWDLERVELLRKLKEKNT